MHLSWSPNSIQETPKLVLWFKDNWNIIQNTEELTQIFKTKPLIGYRRLPNLKDILTSSSISLSRTHQYLNPLHQQPNSCQYAPDWVDVPTAPKLRNWNKSPASTLRKYLNVRHSLPNTGSLMISQM